MIKIALHVIPHPSTDLQTSFSFEHVPSSLVPSRDGKLKRKTRPIKSSHESPAKVRTRDSPIR